MDPVEIYRTWRVEGVSVTRMDGETVTFGVKLARSDGLGPIIFSSDLEEAVLLKDLLTEALKVVYAK